MAGSPKKAASRAARAAAEAAELAVLPEVAIPKAQSDKRRDPEWVARAWDAFLEEPSVRGLARRMGCSLLTAQRLMDEGAPSSQPFLARLRLVLKAGAERAAPRDFDALVEAKKGLEYLIETAALVSGVIVKEAREDAQAGKGALLIAAKADHQKLKGYTDTLAKASEAVIVIDGGKPPAHDADPKRIVAVAFAGLMGGLEESFRRMGVDQGMDALPLDVEIQPKASAPVPQEASSATADVSDDPFADPNAT